jgi:FO synthase
MEEIIRSIGRTPRQRSTAYGEVSELQRQRSFGAVALTEPTYTSAKKYNRKTNKNDLVRNGLEDEERLSSQDII